MALLQFLIADKYDQCHDNNESSHYVRHTSQNKNKRVHVVWFWHVNAAVKPYYISANSRKRPKLRSRRFLQSVWQQTCEHPLMWDPAGCNLPPYRWQHLKCSEIPTGSQWEMWNPPLWKAGDQNQELMVHLSASGWSCTAHWLQVLQRLFNWPQCCQQGKEAVSEAAQLPKSVTVFVLFGVWHIDFYCVTLFPL